MREREREKVREKEQAEKERDNEKDEDTGSQIKRLIKISLNKHLQKNVISVQQIFVFT